MAVFNATLLNAISALLSGVNLPSNGSSIHIDSNCGNGTSCEIQASIHEVFQDPTTRSGNCICNGASNGCNDPCSLDPPEIPITPFLGNETDDESLNILIGLSWPLKDLQWFLDCSQSILSFAQTTTIATTTTTTRGTTTPSTTSTTRGTTTGQTTTTTRPTSTSTTVGSTTATTSTTTTTKPTSTTFTSTAATTTTTKPTSTTSTSTAATTTTTKPTSTTTTATTTTTKPTSTSTTATTATTTTTKPTSTTSTTTTGTTTTSKATTAASTTSTQSTTTTRVVAAGRIFLTSAAPTNFPKCEENLSELIRFIEIFRVDKVLELIKRNTTSEEIDALEEGALTLERLNDLENCIRAANITFPPDAATLRHQLGFGKTDNISTQVAQLGTVMEKATTAFLESFDLEATIITALPLLGTLDECEQQNLDLMRPTLEDCSLFQLYRTMDGSCNNLLNTLWGAAFTPFRRELPAKYDDGLSTFRLASDGGELPSARVVSTTVNNQPNVESSSFTILQMTYGQFLDHDLTSTPISRASFNGYPAMSSPIKCCDIHPTFLLPQCAPITIPSDDPFYGCFNQTCMEFVRSSPFGDCTLGPRQQTNQHSAYIDGSVIYGVKPQDMFDLRSFFGGLLRTEIVNENETLLPFDFNFDNGCNTEEKMNEQQFCFKAGDGRVNEQILLTFFQTLWAQEHNRLATELLDLNPSWDDETLFQEARRIVGAELQQVTYAEFLPTVIGPTIMTASNLFPQTGEKQTVDYDPLIDASIANVFAAAAYRFGHSLIADQMLQITKYGTTKPQDLSTLFFNPFDLYKQDAMCDLARGATGLPARQVDPYFTKEVSGKLFRGSGPFGLDLVALNIQRGRDHGLPPYNDWREFCGLPKASVFEDLLPQISPDRISALENVYSNVSDIDIFIGGISETPLPGAILGHTFTCIIHNQFLRIKRGDRYWFEYRNGPGAFNAAQMVQLHNVTLARIMCNNIPELEQVQRWPLRQPGPDNPKVCCKNIRQYSLDPWIETNFGTMMG